MKKQYLIIGGLGITAIVLTYLLLKKSHPKKLQNSDKDWIKPISNGRLTSPFGYRNDPTSPTKKQLHNGQDIAVPIGTAVVAPMAGTIKSTSPTEGGGNQVVMVHDNGWFTGYAHLSKVAVKVGQKVKQGQIIAYSGNTGKHTTGPHLHFTLTDPKGNKVDPTKYIYK